MIEELKERVVMMEMIEQLKKTVGDYISEDKTILGDIKAGESTLDERYIKGRKNAYEQVLRLITELTDKDMAIKKKV